MLGEARWTAWSTTVHLLVVDPRAIGAAEALLRERMGEVEAAASRFRPDAEVVALRAGEQRVSPVLADLVTVALESARATGGLVDPTVGAALRAAGYDRDIADLVDRGAAADAPPRTDWRSVRVDGDVVALPSGVLLDLGATAKALTADTAAAEIAAATGSGVLVNLGGDVATAGAAPVGGWQVTVQDLPADPATQVELEAGWALATSSTQRRTWRSGGRLQHHIVDPRTGRPARTVWRTASVVAPTAVEANTLATAAIVAGRAAVALLAASGRAARLVDASGLVRTLGGWPAEPAEAA